MTSPAEARCGCGGHEHADLHVIESIELAQLRHQLDVIEAASTAAAQAQIAAVRGRFATDWHEAGGVFRRRASLIRRGVDPFGGGRLVGKAAKEAAARVALEELERGWQKAITRHWQAAFKLGFSSRGKLPPETTMEIQALAPTFKGLVEGQHAAAVKFAQDLAQGVVGKPGRQSYAQRSQAYANAVAAAFHGGAVTGGAPGEKIHWRLRSGDPCPECPVLAASGPYTRETLPCWPGSGSTSCLAQCRCVLEFEKGEAPDAPETPADQVVTAAISDPPQAPIGWRVPEPHERDTLRDLEARLNFARRQIAMHPPDSKDQKKWIRTRRDLNTTMRELTERERIWHVPTFSVPEVVSGFNVAPTAVTDLVVARGVDGATAAAAGEAAVAAATEEAVAEVATRLATAPPVAPALPTAAAVKRAMLPPPAAGEPPPDDGTQESSAPSCACGGGPMQRCRCPLAWTCHACGAHGTGEQVERLRHWEPSPDDRLVPDWAAPLYGPNDGLTRRWRRPRCMVEAEGDASAALPAPFTWQTVSVVGQGSRHTLALSLVLLRLLCEASTPYAVQAGPFDDEHWATLTMELGIWLRGPAEEIQRLLTDWAAIAPAPGLGVAPYLP